MTRYIAFRISVVSDRVSQIFMAFDLVDSMC